MEAFSMLMPADWSFEGGVRWSAGNVMMPAAYSFKVSGDGGTMQALPGQAFFWTDLPHVRLSHPVGSKYLGATVCPLLNASEALKCIVLPALGRGSDYLAIREDGPVNTPGGTLGLECAFKDCGSPSSEAARTLIEYLENGKWYEEYLFCTVTSFRFTIRAGGSDISYIFWIADHMFAFRAPKGRLDDTAGIFQAMVHSFRINPQWLDKYNRIVLFLKDRQMYRHPSLRQLNADVDNVVIQLEDSAGSYALRQSAYRLIAAHIGRGDSTGEYYDPIQQICVRLPASYDHAWASDAGEYLLSNRSDVHPDAGFTGAWRIMEPIGVEPPGIEPSAASAT